MTDFDLYKSLDTNRCEIRVLELLPGRSAATIDCQPRTASVDEIPNEEALSYVWGEPNVDADAVRVRGVLFKATRNLEAALRDLRYEDKSRVLWIDAICINKQGLQGKMGRLHPMGRIYQKAAVVLVHLPGFHSAFLHLLILMAAHPQLH